MPPAQPRDPRTAVDKAMALLNAFGDEAHLGVGVSELARRAGLSKSTAFRLLTTLEENHAVERAGNAYRLGQMIQELGHTNESEFQGRIRDALTPFLADLYEMTRQTVHLAVLHGSDVVYLNKLYGHLHVRSPSRIGGRAPAYCTAVGKILLAHSPGGLDDVISAGLRRWTPHTITDPTALRTEIATVKRRQLAYDREEIMLGLNCIAAPVMNRKGQPVAALSISGPVNKFNPEQFESSLRKACYAASRAAAAVDAVVREPS